MPGAGFIGASATRRHRRSGTIGSFAVTLTGLTRGGAQDGTVLGFSDNGAANPSAQRWQTSVDGGVWVDLPGAGGATLAIDLAGGMQSDTHLIRVGVTIDGLEKFSNTAPLQYAAPLATGALEARDLTLGTGVIAAATAGAFTGVALSYAVSPETIPGLGIDSATGVIFFDTDVMSPQSGTLVQVTVTNSGGSARSSFVLEATAPVTYSAQITGLTDNPTYGPTAQIGVSLIGVIPELRGTETVVHRWADSGGVIGGATTPLYTPTADRDLGEVRYRPLVNGTELTSPAQTVRHAPPVAGSLAPVNEIQGSGSPVVNLAAGFSGVALSYAETVGWAAISGDTLTINDALRDETLTITATNSGGAAEVDLSVRITQAVDTDFILTLETTGANESFTLPLRNAGSYDAILEWGDGSSSTITRFDDPDLTHSYATPGTHTLRMRGTAAGIFFNNAGDRLKVRSVQSLGDLGWMRMDAAFWGCANMTSFASGTTNTSGVTNFFAMLRDCTGMTSCDVSTLDTSAGTSGVHMFSFCTGLTTLDVTNFDTANMSNMAEMFFQCTGLTGLDISGFDVSGLTTTAGLADFSTNFPISAAVWDATLIAWAAQTVLPGVKATLTGAVFTPGGAAEAARASLIDGAGWIIDDLAATSPGRMDPPALIADGADQITATLAALPGDTGGYPILRTDLRWRTGTEAWTLVQDVSSPHVITGLAPETDYQVVTRAVNVIGSAGWSNVASITTTGANDTDFAIENGGDEPVILAQNGAISLTLAAGPYTGSYATDYLGVPLTVAAVQAAPVCLVLPQVTGTPGPGNMLSITPGLWLYDGEDPGDQVWQQQLDGTEIPDGTGLSYEIEAADEGRIFAVRETFGGVSAESTALALIFGPVVPERMAAPALGAESATQITLTLAGDPADGGVPITSYDLRYWTDAGTWVTQTGITSPVVVSGLTPATLYYFQTRALNGVGAGPWSASASATTQVEGVSLATDTGAQFWYSPDTISVDGSGTVTNWPDNVPGASGVFDLDTVPTSASAPTWDAVGEKVVFDGTQILRSGIDFTNLLGTQVEAGGATLVFFAVVETKPAQGFPNGGFIFSMCQSSVGTDSFSFGYTTSGQGASGTNMELALYAAEAGVAFGNNFAGRNTSSGNIPLGKHLLEVHVGPTSVAYYVNGTLEYTEPATRTDYPSGPETRNVLGGRAGATQQQRDAAVDIYEVFCTTSAADAADLRAELQARHGL